jgi:hypothetical protein
LASVGHKSTAKLIILSHRSPRSESRNVALSSGTSYYWLLKKEIVRSDFNLKLKQRGQLEPTMTRFLFALATSMSSYSPLIHISMTSRGGACWIPKDPAYESPQRTPISYLHQSHRHTDGFDCCQTMRETGICRGRNRMCLPLRLGGSNPPSRILPLLSGNIVYGRPMPQTSFITYLELSQLLNYEPFHHRLSRQL